MVKPEAVNNTALCSCHNAVLFLRCAGKEDIQKGGYWMSRGLVY
jgi:hypothetical protein